MCGLGGMGSLQFFHAETGENGMIDFHARAGSLVTPQMWMHDVRGRTAISGYTLFDDFRSELGYTSILTPGTVAGLGEVHQRFCTKSLDMLVRPAARLAEDGSPVGCFAHDFLAREMMAGVPGGVQRVSASEACRQIHLRANGTLYPTGAMHHNPDMARTLHHTIASEGASGFYLGIGALRLPPTLPKNGSFVTAEDLASYRTRMGPPVGSYRGFQIASTRLPAAASPWSRCCTFLSTST